MKKASELRSLVKRNNRKFQRVESSKVRKKVTILRMKPLISPPALSLRVELVKNRKNRWPSSSPEKTNEENIRRSCITSV